MSEDLISEFQVGDWACSISLRESDSGAQDAAWYEYTNKDALGEGEVFGCEFSLLSEVGQFLVPSFERAIAAAGYVRDGTVNHDGKPYIADRLRKKPTRP